MNITEIIKKYNSTLNELKENQKDLFSDMNAVSNSTNNASNFKVLDKLYAKFNKVQGKLTLCKEVLDDLEKLKDSLL